jgi:hypothetical protein
LGVGGCEVADDIIMAATEQQLAFWISLCAGMFGIIVLIIGWIGVRIHSKLDEIFKELGMIRKDLGQEIIKVDRRLSNELAIVDRRTTRLEDRFELHIEGLKILDDIGRKT